MKLIVEQAEEIKFLSEEASGGNKKLYVEGIFLQGAIKNKNGRIYPMEILTPEAERYVREQVAVGSGWGELNHPNTPQINPERVSHRTVSLVREGNDFIGKALVITENPCGAIVAGLINSGGRVGVSSRGLGTLKENSLGILEVQPDYQIATCADFVLNPSAPSAWVNGIMENTEWWMKPTGEWVCEKAEPIYDKMKKMSVRELSEKRVQLFEEYVKTLLGT